MRLILASTSPRRREILKLLGLEFEVVAPRFRERTSPGLRPEEEVMAFSMGKARSLPRAAGSIVVAGDTLIVLDGAKIGKPRDLEEAARILSRLSGRRHVILTGLVITGPEPEQHFAHLERIRVEMLPFSHRDIERYLKVGESLDKAGAYSIQGAGNQLIASISGDYLAAVGLPLRPIAGHLETLGLPPAVDVNKLYRKRSFRNWKDIKILEE